MSKQNLEPYRVTKPIQLLAAWLVGLISVDGAFLTAAKLINQPEWIPIILVIAAVINVPLFLICIFILQTRFRPEMQEDTYYSQYIEKRLNTETRENPVNEIHTVRKQLLDSNTRVLELVESFQSQISTLTQAVSISAQSVEGSSEQKGIIYQLEEKVEQAKTRVELARRRAEWAQTIVSVNDLLPAYEEIMKRFNSERIEVSEVFGSKGDSSIPDTFLVAIGRGVPVENAQEIIRLVADLGLEGLRIAEEDFSLGKVYIGSYAYKTFPVAPVNGTSIGEFLSPNLTTESFAKLIKSKAKLLRGE